MARIFVSYRREDSSWATTSIITRLRDTFGKNEVFHDRDGIDPGRDFGEVLIEQVSKCTILLAVIGEKWTGEFDRRGPNSEHDFVRLEIENALSNMDVHVIPVVLWPSEMPEEDQVPPSISGLCRIQAATVAERGFERAIDDLLVAIDSHLRKQGIELTDQPLKRPENVSKRRADPVKVASIVVTTMVLAIVLVVSALTWGRARTKPQVTGIQSVSTDGLDAQRVAERYRKNPVLPDKETTAEEKEVKSLNDPQYSNFEFRHDEMVWSFQSFMPEAVTPDSQYQSAAVMERTIRVVKTGPSKELRFQARTTGKDVVFLPQEGPASHVETNGGIRVGTGKYEMRAKQLCFDVSEFDVNEAFSVSYRVSFWDAAEEEEPWVGAMGYPGCLRMRVIAVGPKPGFFANVKRKKCERNRSPIVESTDGSLTISDDLGSLVWILEEPEPYKIYMLYY